jgi:hypothetical protein
MKMRKKYERNMTENNLLILTCHPYGILLNDNIFSTDISSLRDFLSYTNKRGINAGIAFNN